MTLGSNPSFHQGSGIFCFQKHPDLLWGSPSLLLNAHQCCFPWVNQPEREVDPLFPFIVKVNNGVVPVIPMYFFTAQSLRTLLGPFHLS